MKSEKRRSQWLAVRALLSSLSNSKETLTTVCYDEIGKPFLNSENELISISHSEKMAAVQISSKKICGIDIQRLSPKMERLAPKFINEQEAAFIPKDLSLDYLNLIWTMKEAVFKHFGSNLEFKRITVEPFDIHHKTNAFANVEHENKSYRIHLEWRRIEDYFLTYLC